MKGKWPCELCGKVYHTKRMMIFHVMQTHLGWANNDMLFPERRVCWCDKTRTDYRNESHDESLATWFYRHVEDHGGVAVHFAECALTQGCGTPGEHP